MRRKNLERSLLCLFMLLFFTFGLNIWLEAESNSKSNSNVQSNASGSGESITKDGKWSEEQSGYRFTIVDKDFNAIKNI